MSSLPADAPKSPEPTPSPPACGARRAADGCGLAAGLEALCWTALVLLMVGRPFIASLAFPALNLWWQGCCAAAGAGCVLSRWGRNARGVGSVGSVDAVWREALSPILPCLPWLVMCGISLSYAPEPQEAWPAYGGVLTGVLVYWTAASSDRRQRRGLLLGLTAAFVLLTMYAVWQYFVGFPATLEYLAATEPSYQFGREYLETGRVFGTFATPNLFASYAATVGLLSAAHWREDTRPWGPWLARVVVAGLIVNLLLARSLGVMLSLGASLLICLILFRRLAGSRAPSRAAGRRTRLFVGFVALLGAVLVARWGDISSLAAPHHPGQRLDYWGAAVRMWMDHPWFGVGFSGFASLYGQYRLPGAAETIFTHNSYLQLLAETGLVGVGGFVGAWAAILRRAVRRVSGAGPGDAWRIAAALVFVLHNLVSFDLYVPEVAWHGWLALGLLSGVKEFSTERSRPDTTSPPPTDRREGLSA